MLAAQFGAGAAFAAARADKITLHVRQTARDGNRQPARAGRRIRPRFREAEELPSRVDDLFDDGEKVKPDRAYCGLARGMSFSRGVIPAPEGPWMVATGGA